MSLADDFNPDIKSEKREKTVESYLKDQVKRIGGLCLKFVSPGFSGVPDRLIIYKGVVVFAEIKRPGKAPRKLQRIRIELLKGHGVPAFSVSSKEQVRALLDKLVNGEDLLHATI